MRMSRWSAVIVLAVATPVGATAATNVGKPPAHPSISVGGFPTGITLTRSTHTVYVGNGTTGTLSLIDGKTCNAREVRGCLRNATAVAAGTDPIGIAVDESTNTVFVVNFSGTVTVVDGRSCHAKHTAGCQAALATVRVGTYPQFLAVDARTHTVYVANSGSNTVSVIDGRRRRVRASIAVGPQPFTVGFNPKTGTLYVTDLGAHTISVIDANSCNATKLLGCRRHPATVNVGETPGGIAVDAGTNTVYVTGETTNDVSVVDGRRCNARFTAGCRARPIHIRAGAGARGIAVNEVTHTVYVANTVDGTVSVIDGAACNSSVHTGCGRRAAVAFVGSSPRRVAVDEATNTIYVTNAGSDTVSIIDGRTCNGRVHTGC